MKSFLNGALLACWALALGWAVFAFGGAAPEYALPLYLLGATLAALWAAKLLLCRPVSWVWSPLHVPVLGFFAYTAARYPAAPIEHAARIEMLHVGLYTLVYFVAACNFYRVRQRRIIVWVLMAVALAEAMYGLWQFMMVSDAVLWFTRPIQYRCRASGTYICPNHLAGLLAMIVLLLLARIIVDRAPSRSLQKSFLFKLVEFYVVVFALIGLYASQSRGGWLATLLALVTGLFWMWRAKALPPRAVDVALGLVVIGAVAALSLPAARQRVGQMFSVSLDYTFDYQIVDWKDPTVGGRADLSRGTWGIVKDHPVWGTGPGTWRWFHPRYRDPRVQYQPQYAHNDALQLLAEYGAAGFVIVLAALGCFFWQVSRFTRPDEPTEQRAFLIGSATAVTAILIHSFVDFNLHLPANAFLMASFLGLTAAITNHDLWFQRREVGGLAKAITGIVLLLVAVLLSATGYIHCRTARDLLAGNDARDARDWPEALRWYEKVIARDAHDAEPHVGIGEVYRIQSAELKTVVRAESQRLAALAVTAYRQALALNPRDAATWQRLGAALELSGDIARARDAHQQALALDPNNALYLLRAAQFHLRVGDTVRAAESLEKSAKLGNAEARRELTAWRARKPARR